MWPAINATTGAHLLVASSLMVIFAACGPAPPDVANGQVPSPATPASKTPSRSAEAPLPDSPNDDPDDVLYRYCLTEEHIIGIETRLLDKPAVQAVRDLRVAQAFAYSQSTALADAGRPEQASAVRAWGQAFEKAISRMRRG